MKVVTSDYDNFELVTDDFGAPDSVVYTATGTTVTGVWAFFLTNDMCVMCGGAGNPIDSTVANLTSDFASAVLLTASINVQV